MLIKLTLKEGGNIDVNASHVVAISDANGDGTLVSLSNGLAYSVTESLRSVRGYIKKAYGE